MNETHIASRHTVCVKMNFLGQVFQKLLYYRNTDMTEIIYHSTSPVVKTLPTDQENSFLHQLTALAMRQTSKY